MNGTVQNASELVRHIIHLFYEERNIQALLTYFAEDISLVGPAKNDYATKKEQVLHYFFDGQEHIPPCNISDEDYSVIPINDENCIVMGKYVLHIKEELHMLIELPQRATFYIESLSSSPKIKHIHISSPYAHMDDERYFPNKLSHDSYDYLQRLLAEKTEVIEMIANNISGGLKGSNDDETFSFFYVNEGLPQMLGYTYDEFMHMSKGSAAGAVYPPDLAKALNDCYEYFAKGPIYSTEYRIRKKDGSLMWVLDTGRKALNNDGEIKINSILMDITPLKTVMAELQVERERYRIALENISDVLFEYDIKNDTLITYQRIEESGKIELDTVKTENFLSILEKGKIIHPNDITKLLSIYKENNANVIEVRIKLQKVWRWTRIQCKTIFDQDSIAIKTIGTLKDITQEKEHVRLLIEQAQHDSLTGLYNQSTAMTFVQKQVQEDSAYRSVLYVIDIDNFKHVNDTFGHLKGNEVLILFSRILHEHITCADIAARIGGDEFLLFFKNTSIADTQITAQKILTAVRDATSADKIGISCSIGIAPHTKENDTYKALFTAADKALYEAKRNGKNCFVLY